MWLKLSTKAKNVVIFICVIIAILSIMGICIDNIIFNNLIESKKVEMFSKANVIAEVIAKDEEDIGINYKNDILSTLSGTGIRGIVLNSLSVVSFDSNKVSKDMGQVITNDFLATAFTGGQNYQVVEISKDVDVLEISVPIKFGSEIKGIVYLTKELDYIKVIKNSVNVVYLCFSAILLIMILALYFVLKRNVVMPLNEFATAATEISKGNFTTKISKRGNAEFDKLADAFNYMNAELEHLEVRRRKFVSDASHELKTPMSTIKLVCDSITSTDTPDIAMVNEFLTDLSEEVDRLTRIIDKLLLLTKLDSGEMTMNPFYYDVEMMLERIKQNLTPIAVSKTITLSLEIQENMPLVMFDYDRIWECVYNIVDNAIKYSKIGGKVIVESKIVEDNLILNIYDQGMGIADEFKERVFERFYRLDDSRARETGGTGLGLAIAKEAVLLHDGVISVFDNSDGGSCFSISFPADTKKQSSL